MAEIPDKPFYKIGEVCQYTDTQPYVLRFWESEFPRLAPEKSRSGQRMYTRRDIDLVLRIKQLLYEEEFTIAGARKKLEQEEAGAPGDVAGPAPDAPAAPQPPSEVPAAVAAPPESAAEAPTLFEPAGPAREPAPAPSPAARARAEVQETEIAALRKRIADLEARHADDVAALAAAEEDRRRDRERRERVAARLEGLLHRLDDDRPEDPPEADRA